MIYFQVKYAKKDAESLKAITENMRSSQASVELQVSHLT